MNVRETPRTKPRYGIDPYLDWLAREGIPVTEDYGVYLFGVETAPWPRYGVKGAAVHLTGRGIPAKDQFGNPIRLVLSPQDAALWLRGFRAKVKLIAASRATMIMSRANR